MKAEVERLSTHRRAQRKKFDSSVPTRQLELGQRQQIAQSLLLRDGSIHDVAMLTQLSPRLVAPLAFGVDLNRQPLQAYVTNRVQDTAQSVGESTIALARTLIRRGFIGEDRTNWVELHRLYDTATLQAEQGERTLVEVPPFPVQIIAEAYLGVHRGGRQRDPHAEKTFDEIISRFLLPKSDTSHVRASLTLIKDWYTPEDAKVSRALGELAKVHQDALLKYLVESTKGIEIAQDLLQEIYVRLYRNIGRHPSIMADPAGAEAYAYARRSAMNIAADYMKSTSYRSGDIHHQGATSYIRQGHDYVWSRPEMPQDPLDTLLVEEEHREVRRAVRELRPAHRAVIERTEFQGLSGEDTATTMGKNVNALKSIKHRAMGALKRRYGLDPEGASLSDREQPQSSATGAAIPGTFSENGALPNSIFDTVTVTTRTVPVAELQERRAADAKRRGSAIPAGLRRGVLLI